METKLLEEKIDALNANLEKILGLMDRMGESKPVENKINNDYLEEQIKRYEEHREKKERHGKELEERTLFDSVLDICVIVKDILAPVSSVISLVVDNAEDIKKILGDMAIDREKEMDSDSDPEGEEEEEDKEGEEHG